MLLMNSFVTRSGLAVLMLLSSGLLAVRAANYVPKAGATGAAAPEFSIHGNVFTNSIKIELKADGAVIRFSLDGSEPTTNSILYKEPISISGCALVRAKAWHRDGRVSAAVSENYTVLADDLRNFSSNLPLLALNIGREEVTAGEKTVAALRAVENRSGRTMLNSAEDFSGLVLLNLRGHSSLRYPKHSYSVKAVNESKEPKSASILGLLKDPDWVLYAPYPDKTLLRDVLAYDLNRQMGTWAPRTRFVELFVSESGEKLSMEHYVGVYVFEEKVARSKSRVAIAKLGAEDAREPEVTGGYIFKKDHSSSRERKRLGADGPTQAATPSDRTGYPTPPGGFPADPAGFPPPYGSAVRTSTRTTTNTRTTTPRASRNSRTAKSTQSVTNYVASAAPERVIIDDAEMFDEDESFRTTLQRNYFYFQEPEPDELTGVQRAWLKDYVNRFESALYGPDFTDAKEGYRAFIDVDSFIDYHLFSEVTKNVDAFRFSTFYYKDRNGLLKMGPVWDWNLSFGNADGKQGYMPRNWLWPQLDDQQYSWFRRLFEDPDFGQRYVDRWQQLRATVFATTNVLSRIDALAAHLDESQKRNFRRWDILGRDVSPNYFVGESYEEEIRWMKNWASNRLDWIEAQFPAAPVAKAGDKIELSSASPAGKIFFTMNGVDPRAVGGKPSSDAQQYSMPIALPGNAALYARTLIDTRWSGLTRIPAKKP
jgi:hypothetical protein